MNTEELRNLCSDCKTAENVVTVLTDCGLSYDNEENRTEMLRFFEVNDFDEIQSRELGRFTIYAEPTEDSNELRDEKGNLIAREETELLVVIWENYIDSGSDDYVHTFAVWTNGEIY